MNKTSENICDALRDLVTFQNFKKVKNTQEGVLPLVKFISSFLTLLKVALHHGCFSPLLNFTNDTKSSKESHKNFNSCYSLMRF